MALKSDGTVWAWGNNQKGELGDGTTTERDTPVQVSGLTGAVAMLAGTAGLAVVSPRINNVSFSRLSVHSKMGASGKD